MDLWIHVQCNPIKKIGHLHASANSPHTIKYGTPAPVEKAIIVGGLGALFLGAGWFLLFRNAYASSTDGEGGAPAAGEATPNPSRRTASAGQSSASRSGRQEPRSETLTDYAKDHLRRFGSMPWSAPAMTSARSPRILSCIALVPWPGKTPPASGRTSAARASPSRARPTKSPRANAGHWHVKARSITPIGSSSAMSSARWQKDN